MLLSVDCRSDDPSFTQQTCAEFILSRGALPRIARATARDDVLDPVRSASCQRNPMIWLERDREAAVATPAVVHADQVKPLRRCIYAGCRDFSGSPQTSDNADNLGIRETVRGDCRLRARAVARVVVALVRAIFLTMRRAPTAHSLACFCGVSFDPLAAVCTTHRWICVRHGESRSRHTGPWRWDYESENAAFTGRVHCCGETIRTSDLRVMSPSSYRCSTPRANSTSIAPRRRTRTIARSAPAHHAAWRSTRRSPARHAARR